MVIRLGPGPEFDLIRRFLERRGAARPDAPPEAGIVVGPGDDSAVVDAGPLAISTDLAVEDIHFRRSWLEPEEVGYRAAAGAASDLAAMAARPLGLLVSLALPDGDRGAFAEAVMAGVDELAGSVEATVLGGDVVRSPGPLVLDVVAVGRCERPVTRSGAVPGDSLWVTGALGGAGAAVLAWREGREPNPAARAAFARPRPRIAEALWLADRVPVHALIDLSDGVAGDAGHLAAASGVRITVEADALPVHPGAAGAGEAAGRRLALSAGEDYELCFAAPAGSVEAEAEAFHGAFGLPLSRIGGVDEGSGAVVRWPDGTTEPARGYQHGDESRGAGG